MEEFDETALICEWSDLHKAVYATCLFRGSAKLFVSFEDCWHSWKPMKKTQQREFKPRIDSCEIHRRLQQRKKRNDETDHEYCYRLMEIGAQVGMEQSAIIQYVVEGIDGDEVSKMMLFGAKYICELKSKLDMYEKIKNKPKIGSRVESLPKKATNKSSDSNKTDKCFNCGSIGHKSKECPMRDKCPKCLKCNDYGHKERECKGANSENSRTCNVIRTNFVKHYKTVATNGRVLIALIDTASDLSLVRVDTVGRIGASCSEKNVTRFGGLGSKGFPLSTEGTTEANLIIDNDCFCVKLHIVPEDVMNDELFLGADFFNTVGLRSRTGRITISRIEQVLEGSKINQIDCGWEVNRIDVSHVTSEVNREKVKALVDDHKPQKSRDVDVKVRIILKDEVPVYQNARRLAPAKREIVHDQIDEWLRLGIVRPWNSDYASPVVSVKKKDGPPRVSVDYRNLNRKIIRNRYPLPIIDDQLDCLRNAKVFSTLDLKNGFFYVPIDEAFFKYTAFIVPWRHSEFL